MNTDERLNALRGAVARLARASGWSRVGAHNECCRDHSYESAILAAVRETIWAERGLLAEVRAERDAALARLEKARGLVLEFAANMGPGFFDSYPTLVKLRAALTGTEGPP